jgi:hypothetical protein
MISFGGGSSVIAGRVARPLANLCERRIKTRRVAELAEAVVSARVDAEQIFVAPQGGVAAVFTSR